MSEIVPSDICAKRSMGGAGVRGHFLYRTVQGCAAGIGVLFMPEIIL